MHSLHTCLDTRVLVTSACPKPSPDSAQPVGQCVHVLPSTSARYVPENGKINGRASIAHIHRIGITAADVATRLQAPATLYLAIAGRSGCQTSAALPANVRWSARKLGHVRAVL